MTTTKDAKPRKIYTFIKGIQKGSGCLSKSPFDGVLILNNMRYSILGFNQERVLSLTAMTVNQNGEEVELSLDLNDLLILNLMSDFPNRTKVRKIIKDEKVFFWASYEEILKELPILNIKKQALSKRFDKLEKMHIIEREYLTISGKNNLTFFSLTKTYESLLYGEIPSNTEIRDPIVFEYDTLSYLNTTPSNTQIRDNNNIADNNKEKDNIAEKRRDANASYEGEPSCRSDESINWKAFHEFFNSTMANKAIKPISFISDKRKGNVRARMREYGKKALFDVIKKAAASDFLNGKNQRGFTATFDWLFLPNNFPKVLEGNYDNREGVQFFNNNYQSQTRDEQRAYDVQRRQQSAAGIIARLEAEENEGAQ